MKALHITAKQVCASLLAAIMFTASTTSLADNRFYQQHNLASDGFVTADHTDLNLINAWGIVFNPFGPAWVADNGSGVSTLYDGNGVPFPTTPLVVKIPSPGSDSDGKPTGIVFNGSTGFSVSKGTTSAPSHFIFATEDGIIAGWASTVDATHAIQAIHNPTAIYKGLTLSAGGNGSLLYASDFHNNKIDVFDSAFQPVSLPTGAFTDPKLPNGYAPFGLQAINGDIYVSYAKQDAKQQDDVKGKGFGFINVFDPNGNLIRRVVSAGKLNAPWGMAVAPAGFGKFSGRLLVGNFGDGKINSYDQTTGEFVGQLNSADHKPLQIEGLWGLAFGNGFLNQPVNSLFFTAGPAEEKHGLYGRIDSVIVTGH